MSYVVIRRRPWFRRSDLTALSTTVLRATLLALSMLGAKDGLREAIAHELAVRAWAAAVEQRLGTTIAWCRGGRS